MLRNYNQYVGHHQKVFPSWQRTPQPSHRSLPNSEYRKYGDIVPQPGNVADLNATTAYFSEHPPMEPIKLAMVGNYPNTALKLEKIQQLVKNCEAINFFQTAVYGSKLSGNLYPSSKKTTTTAMEKSEIVSASPTIYSLADAKRHSQNKDKKLIADLSVCSTSPISESPRDRSASPVTHRSSCSIAVQARMVDFKCSSEDKLISKSGEEWIGGVRALRDSHVRLVQRQLRHIERLNRALDRVAKNSKKQVHF